MGVRGGSGLGLRGLVQGGVVGKVVLDVEGHCEEEWHAGLKSPTPWPPRSRWGSKVEE